MPSIKHQQPGATENAPGFLRLFAAIFYDSFLLLAVLFVATALALPFNSGQAFAYGQILYPAYLIIVSFLFFGWFWTHGGQTLGMRSWRIKLTTSDKAGITWKRAARRFICASASWMCFGLGFLWILLDKHQRSWHDILSGTHLIVITS